MKLADRREFLKIGAALAAGSAIGAAFRPAWAEDVLNPRAANAQLLAEVGSGGALSGLTWNSGAFSKVDQLAAFRGRPVDLYGSFINHATWSTMLGFPYNTSFPSYCQKPVWISLGYPLIPKNYGGMTPTKWTQLATPGNALYDDYFAKHLQIAQNLGAVMRSSKRRCRGVIVRVGWEFNGSQAWKLTDYTKSPEYREVFRHLVAILRANVPDILIDWNPLRKGTQRKLPIENIYPGNDVVDIVSICHYDRLPSFNSQAIWDEQYVRLDGPNPWGIGTWLDFAKRNGKKLAVPEWGLANGMKYADQSKDNPLYMQLMFNFFKQNAQDIAYESYFNNISYHQIVPTVKNPKGAAAYKALYSA